MKVLAIVLLSAFAAVQGRSAVKVADNSSSEVALENKPWLAHLRYAISTSGLLQTATGSLISPRFVLTTRDLHTASFIWIRCGVVKVIYPTMVIESTAFQHHGSIGLVNLNRDLPSTDLIAPIPIVLPQQSGSVSGESCGFGHSANGGPGENLQCFKVAAEVSEDGNIIGSSENLSEFDLGAALVSDDQQSAVLVSVDSLSQSVEYAMLDLELHNWISEVTGLPSPSPSPQPDSSEHDSKSSESEEGSIVKFVSL